MSTYDPHPRLRSGPMIRVAHIDRHPVIQEGLKRVASTTHFLSVVRTAVSTDGLQTLLEEAEPDVVLLDFATARPDIVSVLARIAGESPGPEVVVMTADTRPDLARRCLDLGARGYLSKEADPSEIVEAITRADEGRAYLPQSVTAEIARDGGRTFPHEALSRREFQVLQMSVSGLLPSQIARHLSLSPKTVSTYRRRILEKLDVETFPGAIRYAVEHEVLGKSA